MRLLGAALAACLCLFFSQQLEARGGGGRGGARSVGASNGGHHSVRGYTRRDGTYVAPHRATNPNATKMDNWSTKGNVNPFTGKAGTVDPFAAKR